MDGHRVSTIIVDSNEDSALMCIDDQGFHPKEISVPKVLCCYCCCLTRFQSIELKSSLKIQITGYLLADDSKRFSKKLLNIN